MLQRIREHLTVILIGLLPFHALLVTALTKLLIGPGHEPLFLLALWKEALLALILFCSLCELGIKRRMLSLRDLLDVCIIAVLLYAGLLETWTYGYRYQSAAYLFGFKYDFLPLIAFFILRRVEWSKQFKLLVKKILLIDGILLSAYGFVSFFLPVSFFTTLGYSDLHSLYVQNGPLAPFQQIGGMALRRVQSAMSGPNQFGLWLLFPLAILFNDPKKGNTKFLIGVLLFATLALTFSRAAWLGCAAMILVVLLQTRGPKVKAIALPFLLVGIPLLLGITIAFPSIFLRFQSSSDHIRRPIEAVQLMIQHPFGMGLGKAGPASNALSDTCIDLEPGADASWAKDRQDLCVFVGGEKFQPLNRDCSCPVLTENWYLQWGVELGFFGLLISLLIPYFILRRLGTGERTTLLTFLGLSIAGLFLHSFEDSAVAYTIWIMLSATLHPWKVRTSTAAS